MIIGFGSSTLGRSSRCWLCRYDLRVSSPVVESPVLIMVAAHAVVLSRWWSMSSAGDGFRRGVGGFSICVGSQYKTTAVGNWCVRT